MTAVLATLYIGMGAVRAGSFGPTLAIGQVVARPAGVGAMVEITGILGFDDLMQVNLPLSLLIYQDDRFVRYPIGGVPQSGTFRPIRSGLLSRKIERLEAAGQDEPQAGIIRLEPSRLVAELPPSIGNGTVTAVLYVVLPDLGYFQSNEVSTTLEGVVGGSP